MKFKDGKETTTTKKGKAAKERNGDGKKKINVSQNAKKMKAKNEGATKNKESQKTGDVSFSFYNFYLSSLCHLHAYELDVFLYVYCCCGPRECSK